MAFRNNLTGLIFLVLLLFGPVDHNWPVWLLIRLGYLILIPLIVWLILGWLLHYWQPSNKVEIILDRVLAGIVCIGLFGLAVLEATSKTHIGNTQWINTRDGMEAVGDDITLPGPDRFTVLCLTIIGLLVLWFGVLKKGSNSSNKK